MRGIGEQPGYNGAFTRDQAKGAIPNGTRITKINSEPGDTNADGSTGRVLGSVCFDYEGGPVIAYFVEWDARRHWAVLCVEKKLTPTSKH